MNDEKIKEEISACTSILEEAYKTGYKDGVYDAQHSFLKAGNEAMDKTLNLGLTTAWDYARLIMLSKEEGGMDFDTFFDIFEMPKEYVLRKYSVNEVIAKISAYEKAKNRCGNCIDWGTVNCAETYREPSQYDAVCTSFRRE